MARLLIRNARVLTLDEADREWPRANIVIEDGFIKAIGPGGGQSGDYDRVIGADGLLAMPGLINAHFHSSGNLMKGCLPGLPLELFMLYEVPPLAAGGDAERLAYVRTLLGAVEMLRRGVTAVHDDAYHVPVAQRGVIDAIMRAYEDVGIRASVAIDQPTVVEYEKYPWLTELLPEAERRSMAAAPRQSPKELLELYAHLIDRWHGRADGRLGAAVSCSAPQRVTADYLEALAGLARRHDLPFNIHLLETRLQRVLGDLKYGKSLVRYVSDLGVLGEQVLAIHAIWIDEDDAERLAESGCTVAHNPVCNLRLGSGVMPLRLLRKAGVPICLGSDEMNVDDTVNMWFVAKTAALLQTLTTPEYREWPDGPEMLAALTRGGARAMRQAGRIGQIAPGFAADLLLLDLDTAAFTPLNDLRRQLVFCEDGGSVRYTIVAGRVVYEEGRVTTVDEKALRSEARSLMSSYGAQLARADREARRLEPYYREMYFRAAARDVGLRRQLHPSSTSKGNT
jgi:cytosine/adenosine deaminase-related metal-dependent hydrolase